MSLDNVVMIWASAQKKGVVDHFALTTISAKRDPVRSAKREMDLVQRLVDQILAKVLPVLPVLLASALLVLMVLAVMTLDNAQIKVVAILSALKTVIAWRGPANTAGSEAGIARRPAVMTPVPGHCV